MIGIAVGIPHDPDRRGVPACSKFAKMTASTLAPLMDGILDLVVCTVDNNIGPGTPSMYIEAT